jgi:hypothetical protein
MQIFMITESLTSGIIRLAVAKMVWRYKWAAMPGVRQEQLQLQAI